MSDQHDDVFVHVSDDEFEKVWNPPRGLWGKLKAVQNQNIGMRFIATSFFFFALAGLLALMMRLQLIGPENNFLDPQTYNRFFTMHGSTMMFLFLIPLVEGIGTLVLPQMLGSRELPFPRLTSFAYWTFLAGGLIFYSGFIFNAVPESGWFAYVPLTTLEFSPDKGMDFWLLGLNVAEVGAIAGAIELILAFFTMRAPGMTLSQIPIFVWSILVMAFMMIFAFTPLIVGSLLLEIDRKFGTHFYNPDGGGSALLWQHLFWIFGHPDVYIQFIPPIGMLSTIIPVFSRRPLVGYNFVVIALVSTGFLSFGLWVHHMFTTGLPELALSFFSAASLLIVIPSGIQAFAWIATMWRGNLVFKTPLLFSLGFFIVFILGGITGVMVGVAPFDFQVHDSYFVVAHLHYVLFGGAVFPVFAGIYYWTPKFLGKMLNERIGKWHFWLLLIGFNVAFFPMHISGLLGMPRRVYTYQAGLGWDIFNFISTVGAFIVALSVITFFYNVYWSLRYGEDASDNPWNADTLEWATPTPTRQYGFRTLPIVHSRHPLWQQENLHQGTEAEEMLVKALALWPKDYRAQLVVTTLDARPKEVIRIAGPSIWPVVAAIGAMFFSFFLIYDLVLPTVISAVVTAVSVIGWHATNRLKKPENPALIREFERRTGIPVYIDQSPTLNRWTMLLMLLSIAIVIVTLVFTHLYLRLQSPQWPPADITIPNPLLPVMAVVALLVSSVSHYIATTGIDQRSLSRLRGGLITGGILGVVSITMMIYHATQLGFDHTTNAYGSSFFALGVVEIAIIMIGVLMSLITVFWIIYAPHEPHEYEYVQEIAFYWYAATAFALMILVVLYLLPHFI